VRSHTPKPQKGSGLNVNSAEHKGTLHYDDDEYIFFVMLINFFKFRAIVENLRKHEI
jgi:hypothetical protein